MLYGRIMIPAVAAPAYVEVRTSINAIEVYGYIRIGIQVIWVYMVYKYIEVYGCNINISKFQDSRCYGQSKMLAQSSEHFFPATRSESKPGADRVYEKARLAQQKLSCLDTCSSFAFRNTPRFFLPNRQNMTSLKRHFLKKFID